MNTVTLGELLLQFGPPSFIKIDVEGAEKLIIESADELLASCRPIFYIEIASHFYEWFAHYFHEKDYTMHDAITGEVIQSCQPNTLFIPSKK